MSGAPFRPLPLRLETERLSLEPFRDSDAEAYAALIAERGPGSRGAGTTVEQAGNNIERLLAEEAESGIGFRVVRLAGAPEVLGYAGILVGRSTFEEPELAYELFRNAWGRGIATEAAGEMVQAAAGSGRQRLWASVATDNVASLRVLAKLGFRHDHLEPELIYLVRELQPGGQPATLLNSAT